MNHRIKMSYMDDVKKEILELCNLGIGKNRPLTDYMLETIRECEEDGMPFSLCADLILQLEEII